MELKALHPYSNMYFTLEKGDSTEGRIDITPEMKTYLIETFPDWFELVPSSFDFRVPEEGMKVMTKEETSDEDLFDLGLPLAQPKAETKVKAKVAPKVAPKAKGKK